MTEETAPTPAPEPKQPKTETSAVIKHAPESESQSAAEKPPTVPPPKKKSFRLVRLLRRRHRLLMFIGALIVFGTFVLKDALREQLKDLVDSISGSENLFLLRGDSAQIMRSFDALNAKMDAERFFDEPAKSRLVASPTLVELSIWHLEPSVNRDKATLDYASAMLEKLPKRDTRDIIAKIDAARSNLNLYSHGVTDLASKVWTIHSKDDPASVAVLRQASTLADDQANIYLEISHTEEAVLDRAREKAQYYERRYMVYTWISYVLYGIGWLLGLAGRLVGVEGVGDSGD